MGGEVHVIPHASLASRDSTPDLRRFNGRHSIFRDTPFAVDAERTFTEFIVASLSSLIGRRQIKNKARVIHQASINQQDLKSLIIPLPPLDEQRRIVDHLTIVDRKLQAEQRRKDALLTNVASLLHDLMTGQRRVHDLDLDFAEEDAA